jgi:hypothetical protein
VNTHLWVPVLRELIARPGTSPDAEVKNRITAQFDSAARASPR